EKPIALGLGIGLLGRRDRRHSLGERIAYEAPDLAAVALDMRGQDFVGSMLDIVRQRLNPRSVRCPQVLRGGAPADGESRIVDLERSVAGQPRLADARLAG